MTAPISNDQQLDDVLLTRSKSRGSEAILLAAGEGSRMSPLVSQNSPKALLTIANRPMIFYSLLCLLRAAIKKVTIVVQRKFKEQILSYCQTDFWQDSLVKQLGTTAFQIESLVREDDFGTADVLRSLSPEKCDVIVLSSDYIGNININDVLDFHRQTSASCTTVVCETKPSSNGDTKSESTKQQKGKKQNKKKSAKADESSDAFTIDHYALLADSDTRLVGYYTTSDLVNGDLVVRSPVVSRYPLIRMRSDLFDPHVYIFNRSVLQRILQNSPSISSIKFDLVPYLARRQQTLSKTAEKEGWTCPASQVRVSAMVVKNEIYSKRANTIPQFTTINMKVASTPEQQFFNISNPSQVLTNGKEENKKQKKPAQKQLPFASAGERVNVTADSLVGSNVTAGNKTSVKKSVVGSNSVLGSGVKINGCILIGKVSLENDVNASNCVFCDGCVIGNNSVLKNCQVATDFIVPPNTEASNQSFTHGNEFEGDDEEKIDLGDDIEFC